MTSYKPWKPNEGGVSNPETPKEANIWIHRAGFLDQWIDGSRKHHFLILLVAECVHLVSAVMIGMLRKHTVGLIHRHGDYLFQRLTLKFVSLKTFTFRVSSFGLHHLFFILWCPLGLKGNKTNSLKETKLLLTSTYSCWGADHFFNDFHRSNKLFQRNLT